MARGLVGVGLPECFRGGAFCAPPGSYAWQGLYVPRHAEPEMLGKLVWDDARHGLETAGGVRTWCQMLLEAPRWDAYLRLRQQKPAASADPIPDHVRARHRIRSHILRPDRWQVLEWAYLVDPVQTVFTVLRGRIRAPITYRLRTLQANGPPVVTEHHYYEAVVASQVDLCGNEPDWGALRRAADALAVQVEQDIWKPRAWLEHPLMLQLRLYPRIIEQPPDQPVI